MPQVHIRKGRFHLEIDTCKWKGHIRLRGLCFDVGNTFTWSPGKGSLSYGKSTQPLGKVTLSSGTGTPLPWQRTQSYWKGAHSMWKLSTFMWGLRALILERTHGALSSLGETTCIWEEKPFIWELKTRIFTRAVGTLVEAHTLSWKGFLSCGKRILAIGKGDTFMWKVTPSLVKGQFHWGVAHIHVGRASKCWGNAHRVWKWALSCGNAHLHVGKGRFHVRWHTCPWEGDAFMSVGHSFTWEGHTSRRVHSHVGNASNHLENAFKMGKAHLH